MTAKAIDAVLAGAWAIEPQWLETIAAIAERESEYHGRPEALEAKLGRPLGNTMVTTLRDGVATIPFEGPMFRKANLMTEYSGATSYATLARDFTAALENPEVKAIVGYFDTPGGQVTGASELAAMIHAARGKKPLIAYVGGSMSSAGLWIGTAFDEVVAAPTAMVGCLGAQMGVTVREPRQGEKSYRFVSSQTPLKNADPGTPEGAAEAQQYVDSVAQVFIEQVAQYRGTTAEDVLSSWGKGAVLIASDAQQRGMIDRVSTYESLISELSKPKGNRMNYDSLTAEQLAAHRPDLVAAIGEQAVAKAGGGIDAEKIRAEGAAAERQRIADVRAAALPGHEALIEKLAFDGKTTGAEAALQVLAAERQVRTGAASSRAADAQEPVKTDADATGATGDASTDAKAKAPAPAAFDIYQRWNQRN